jgi:hypothetical protein
MPYRHVIFNAASTASDYFKVDDALDDLEGKGWRVIDVHRQEGGQVTMLLHREPV